MPDPSQLSTTLFATLITSVCYGIAVVLFIKSVLILIRKRKSTGQVNLPLAITSTLIFIFATTNVLGLWANIHAAFVLYPGGPKAYLALITTPAKTVIQTGQLGAILLADALVVYRTFIVWNSNIYAVVLPCLTFVATFTCGVAFVHLQHTTSVQTSIFSKAVTEWTVGFLLCSFATTVYSTGLITFKLWNAQRHLRKSHGSYSSAGLSRRIMKIMMESAAIYSLNHLLYAVLYEVKTNVESTPSFLEASLASITCSLIIVRCEKAIVRPQTLPTYANSTSMSTSVGDSPARGKFPNERMVFALQPMESVDISKSRDSDRHEYEA